MMGNSWLAMGRRLCGLTLLGAIGACGGSDDEAADGSGGPATVSAPWSSYCVATFTEDTTIMDFGEPLFTARAGDEYLLTDWFESGETRVTMAHITPNGPYEFELNIPADSEPPFTSSCELDMRVSYYAAFTDVAVYSDEALTTKICDLKAGTAVRRSSTASGYSAVDFSFSGPATYEVFLNAFASSCGGADTGYVSVPETNVFRTTTWLVPIISILGPS
jgi:hypothetical protein